MRTGGNRRYRRDPDRGPIERITGRAKQLSLLVIMITGLVGYGAAVQAYESGLALERAEAEGYPVIATVVSRSDVGDGQTGWSPLAAVQVEWRDQGHQLHRDRMIIPTTEASTLTLWVSADGTLSTHRRSHGHTVGAAVAAGLIPVVVAASWLGTGYVALIGIFRRRASRQLRADVDREWSQVEPRWRRQLL